ncbi:hypothetical protein [Sphingorhabdus sp. SMR4y]|uniref:hypothetical protein n=1 Tax=Sphingorhabdus sp. SMR4y TaxID=2584094 RepID=UPI0011AB35BA|nr:hypothetical protein [Sphingorhabdus sp. SMR4y]
MVDLVNWSMGTLAGAAWLLSACNGMASNGAAVQPSRGEVAIAASPVGASAVMRTADAIMAGQAAEESSDAAAMRAAARTLESLGARPDGDQAVSLSRGWNEKASLIDPSVSPPVYRGRALGPSYKKGLVSATSRVSIAQIFLAGKKASVALVPVSEKPVSIEVSDGEGKKICSRHTSSRPANCEWLPLFTERYQINIRTSESRPVPYYLVSN